MKRNLSMILACVLLFTSMFALSAVAFADDSVTLDIIQKKSAISKDVPEQLFVQRWVEATGATVNWTQIMDGDFEEKVNLLVASYELPDIILGRFANQSIITQYLGQDVFVDVTDAIDQYMPNLSAVFAARPEYKAMATAPDGRIYSFPYIEEMFGLTLNMGTLYINQVWLDNLGLTMPTTLDEFRDVLRAFRDNDANNNGDPNDEIPFTYINGTSGTGAWLSTSINQFMGCFGQANTQDAMALDENGQIFCTAMTDAFRDGMDYFAEMYAEGLIDPEFATQDNTQVMAKVAGENVVGATVTWWNGNLDAVNGAEFVVVPYLTGEGGLYGCRENFQEMFSVFAGAITTACDDVQAACEFIDYLYGPQTSVEANWGPLDYNYILDENGLMVWNPVLQDGFTIRDEMRQYNSPANRVPLAVLNSYYDTVVEYPQDAAMLLDDMRTMGFMDNYINEPYIPSILWYSEDDNARLVQLETAVYSVLDRYRASFILDNNVDEMWDTFIAEMEAAGIDEMLQIVQKSYDSYLANLPK